MFEAVAEFFIFISAGILLSIGGLPELDLAHRRIGCRFGNGMRPVTAGSSAPAYASASGNLLKMALAARSAVLRAGAEAEVREAMTSVLREANEDPSGFLVHSPYVVHELRPI